MTSGTCSTLVLASRQTPECCDGETELRRLPPGFRNQIVRILDAGDAWKELAAIIPKPDKEGELLLSASEIAILDGYKSRPQGSPSNSLFEHWSTFGRKRPTIRVFFDLLMKAKLFRAANLIAIEILKESPVEEDCPDTSTLCALNTLTETLALNQPNEKAECNDAVVGNASNGASYVPTLPLDHYEYALLAAATREFSDLPSGRGGCQLGEGAFGTVYRGTFGTTKNFAIKRLKEKINSQFITEMEVLSTCKDPNLLPLLGYSIDGPFGCLIYEYMENGSLQDCLAHSANHFPIPWTTRISIATGTARGICHLHNFEKEALVHRDIKSANILLDKDLNPKVGDFGLVRIGNSGSASTNVVTNTVFGTSVYMAPEAFRGDVSVKLDTFSFGVVLLELLTGLPPYDANREETDILSYMEEQCDNIEDFLDSRAGDWSPSTALRLYNIANKCIEGRKKNRPTMLEVLPSLEELLQSVGKLSLRLSECTSLNDITYV